MRTTIEALILVAILFMGAAGLAELITMNLPQEIVPACQIVKPHRLSGCDSLEHHRTTVNEAVRAIEVLYKDNQTLLRYLREATKEIKKLKGDVL